MKRICFFTLFVFVAVTAFSQHKLFIPFRDSITNKWGYIDTSGSWLIKPKFAQTTPFYKGRAVVKVTKYLFSIIDTTGKQVIPAVYDEIDELNKDIVVASKKKKRGWLHYTGKEKSAFIFNWIGNYDSTSLTRVTMHGYAGFVNPKGRVVIAPKFKCLSYDDYGGPPEDGGAVLFICNDKKWALFDTSGRQLTKFVIEPSRGFYDMKFAEGVCPVTINEKDVFINVHGRVVPFDSLTYVRGLKRCDSLLTVNNGKRFGDENEWPKPDLSAEKNTVFRNYNRVFNQYINKDGSLAFVNTARFAHHNGFKEEYMVVWEKKKYGVIDKTGRLVAPLQFELIDDFENGLAKVWKDNPGYREMSEEQLMADPFVNPYILIGYVANNGKVYLWDKP